MRHERNGRARGVLVLGGAALVALGLWFGQFFKGPGLGGGSGADTGTSRTGTETGTNTGTNTENGPDTETGADPGPEIVPLTPPIDKADAGDRTGPLHVVMEPDGYSLAILQQDGTTRYEPITLEQIVAEVPTAEESPDGYRVLITSRRKVSVGAHLELVRELEAAGLKPEEILGYESLDVEPEEAE
jgi:hypothetical protein